MDSASILIKPVIDKWLQDAKKYLKKDGYLAPMLLVKFTNNQVMSIALTDLVQTNDFQLKRLYFTTVGNKLRDKHGEIDEAVMIVEGWYVRGGTLNVLPSKHPLRQEAICIIGRNASKTRVTSVIQPFVRGKNKQPLWKKVQTGF